MTSVVAEKADARRLLGLTREYWGIENQLHRVRDVTCGEDASQVRSGAAPQVCASAQGCRSGGVLAANPLRRQEFRHHDVRAPGQGARDALPERRSLAAIAIEGQHHVRHGASDGGRVVAGSVVHDQDGRQRQSAPNSANDRFQCSGRIERGNDDRDEPAHPLAVPPSSIA